MPILHVRNVPERLYERLQKLAASRHRSVSAEVITMLETFVTESVTEEERRTEQHRLLADIFEHRYTYPEGTIVPDSADLLREDRER